MPFLPFCRVNPNYNTTSVHSLFWLADDAMFPTIKRALFLIHPRPNVNEYGWFASPDVTTSDLNPTQWIKKLLKSLFCILSQSIKYKHLIHTWTTLTNKTRYPNRDRTPLASMAYISIILYLPLYSWSSSRLPMLLLFKSISRGPNWPLENRSK